MHCQELACRYYTLCEFLARDTAPFPGQIFQHIAEFYNYLGLIVTAAVYWGFGSKLAPLPLTFQHWAGISPYTYTSVFAETYGFVNQSLGPFHCGPLLLPE
jgi:hypothetical protein